MLRHPYNPDIGQTDLMGAGADVGLRGGNMQIPAEAWAQREGHHDISEFLLYHEKRPAS